MKFLIVIVIVIIFISNTASSKEIIHLDNGITFVSPKGLSKLSIGQILQKWPDSNPPIMQFAVGNKNLSTTVGYKTGSKDLTNISLSSMLNPIIAELESQNTRLHWLKSQIVELSGQDWIHLEFTAFIGTSDVINIILITKHKNRAILFNFNSTRSDFVQYEKTLRESIKSIKIPK